MKKQWISVKCGLSRDPKHRQAMGESIWLYLHILDITTWEDGIVHDWKDEAAAEEMGMPVRTLREHRRRLSELGYITCNQKQYTQDVVVHNWTNPREYNGKVYNQKQGDMDMEVQGDTQGDTQGSRKDVTPTSNSNIKESLGIDWKIAHGEKVTKEDLQSNKEDEVETLLSQLDREFHTSFARTPKSQSVARFVLGQIKKGESLDRFMAWAKRDEFNASRLYEYAEQPDKIRTRWAQAFVKESSEGRRMERL